MQISVVILTFNRPDDLLSTVKDIYPLVEHDIEIIVVDNASERSAQDVLGGFPEVTVIRLSTNIGVAGRNAGIEAASGEVVVCLDDDVCGIREKHLQELERLFELDPETAGICFQVRDAVTDEIINWVHHRDAARYGQLSFETYEITEGAVAFRKDALSKSGLYPTGFFISHEGPDLALRLMNCGYKVTYSPEIIVRHSHSDVGRADWRRYYFDTRNSFFLAARNLPMITAVLYVLRQVSVMGLFSFRDGYVKWWAKGVRDGFVGLFNRPDRNIVSQSVIRRIRDIKKSEESHAQRLLRFLRGKHVGY